VESFVLENELRSSPKCKEIFGLSADAQFRYEDFLSIVHPEDRSLVEASVARRWRFWVCGLVVCWAHKST
jgi:hypothetical protein